VAAAIAEEFGGVVQVHGAEAARRLGFNTQVPARPIFLTSGPNRRFHLGQMEVTLKHVSPRKLALAGSMAGVALTALWYLGKDNVSPQTIERVRTRLAPEEFEALRTATQIMPGWMRDAFVGHEGKSVEICPEAAKQTEPPTRPKESQTLSAQELLRMPRTQRMKILDEAAIVARGDYSQHPELTNFEALGAADLHE
jgi:hypothetical protein